MTLRIVEVTAKAKHREKLQQIAADNASVLSVRVSSKQEGLQTISMLVAAYQRQKLLDKIQSHLSADKDWRIVVLPVEAVIPQPEQPEEAAESLAKAEAVQTREELYADVESGAVINVNFLVLVVLSTVVAAIGLMEDNVAIVIGAMVIAPLLGPNLASILGIALGDRELILQAAKASAAGLLLSLVVAVVIGLVVPPDFHDGELVARTRIGLDGIVLALASGAAAALSLTTGLSSALVGVMVAVALLPPVATLGLMLAAGQGSGAIGAALLLATNIVGINLAGQVVFLVQGVKPRTWLEKRSAHQSVKVSLSLWVACLVALVAIIVYWRQLH